MTPEEFKKAFKEETGIDLSLENIHREPEHSTRKLIFLEKVYRINTFDVVHFPKQVENRVGTDTLKEWLDTYSSFKFFKGNEEDINTIKEVYYGI